MAKKAKAKPKKAGRTTKIVRPDVIDAEFESDPQILVFTPVHDAGVRFLDDAFKSLLAQTFQDWCWAILPNEGAVVPEHIRADRRVHVIEREPTSGLGIGYLKRCACLWLPPELLGIPYLLELDCDDVLNASALRHVHEAFKGGADFVHSDCAEFYYDASGNLASRRDNRYPYGEAFGWKHYTPDPAGAPFHLVDAARLVAMHSPPVTAQNIRLIEWTPNHLRAWTRDLYTKVGGHNRDLRAADDHDLVVRMFLAGAKFHHLNRCLYYQRVHTANSQTVFNGDVRAGTWNVYNKNIFELARKFSQDNDLRIVDLCSGPMPAPGMDGWDRIFGHNLEGLWPAGDSTVGLIKANDAVEHLRDPIHTMNEAHRVLAPGGFFLISVPSTDGRGAFCDPTHISFWNTLSFRYYCDPDLMRFVPGFKGKFVCTKLIQWFPTPWHHENNVPYVEAHLMKDYDGRYGWHMQGNG